MKENDKKQYGNGWYRRRTQIKLEYSPNILSSESVVISALGQYIDSNFYSFFIVCETMVLISCV